MKKEAAQVFHARVVARHRLIRIFVAGLLSQPCSARTEAVE